VVRLGRSVRTRLQAYKVPGRTTLKA